MSTPPAPALIPVLQNLLGERAATVLDVGARWGMEASWYALPPLVSLVGFEPDADECARLNEKASAHQRYEPVALGKEDGRVPLTITEEPGCSSLFPPDPSVIERYPLLEVMRPRRQVEVEVTRLATWSERTGCRDVAFMKLDVQGAELAILEGAGSLLDGCVGLEAEVEFFPLYQGQPLFSELERFRAQFPEARTESFARRWLETLTSGRPVADYGQFQRVQQLFGKAGPSRPLNQILSARA